MMSPCCLSLHFWKVAFLTIRRRFLRARRFVPQDALQQFMDTEKWREQNLIGDLYENIDVGDYEETRKLVSAGLGVIFHSPVV